ncbi:uncharacterized protein LOC127094906 [Lathyrus oleraceus]|uniref:uncharacterized protein LOC127094906 n=1 Tax=Pisum sativum TaxID=3888 RepID=UPI0021D2B03D|nr:uncharacterized protein LOC127094906 [Pisum sativum]
MARQSDTSSYTTMSDSHSTESHHPTREDPVVDAATSSHARRPKETILSGNRDVPGVSVPLNTIIPDIAACQDKAVVLRKNVTDNVEQPDAHEGSKVEKPSGKVRSEKANVTQSVEDNPRAETINVEELSDNELLATVVPRIAKRVRTRREKKAVELKSPSKEVGATNPHKQPESESTHKRKSYGPTKAWSKEVPKKLKTKAVVVESESDAPCDVTASMSRKKPSSSRLATSVPEVPIDNHVPDIVLTSGETSKAGNQPDKADVITVLKETCKELGARKHALEQLILQLESTAEDTDGAEGQMAEEEEEASSEEEADEEADDEAED